MNVGSKQKRVLLLGGSRFLKPVLEAARRLGYYAITCDYLPDNWAHKYSDEYRNVSIIDKEAVLQTARELRVDGIMSYACDPGVTTAAYVAEKMGLPNVGPYESVEILQNKGRFRKFLAENGFNVPTAKSYASTDEAVDEAESLFHWPIIVKPTDSAGSKGVTRVDTPDQLRTGVENALRFSLSNEFIIEDFIEKKGFASSSDSFSVDGKLKFVSFDDQRFDSLAENPYTPSTHSWPSTMSESSRRELTSEFQRLLTLLNMRTAIYNVESREDVDGKAFLMEVAPRSGGNRLAEVLRYATGVDMIANALRDSVGDSVSDIEQRPYNGYWAEVVLHGDKPGVFDRLWIADEIRPNVIEEDLWVESGAPVAGFSAANALLGTVILKFDSQERMNEVLDNQRNFVQVLLK